jgi:ABC-type xylose transport system permease subunit
MTVPLAVTNNGMWGIALVIGLVAALIVAGLLLVLVRAVRDIDRSVGALLGVAGAVAANTAHIPQLQATAPVLGEIVDEAVVQDGYMNALTDGYGGVPA